MVNLTHGFKEQPTSFRYGNTHPVMPFLRRSWVQLTSRQLFAGGAGSGASMHFHSAAYNALFFGTKHWLLLPPRYASISAAKVRIVTALESSSVSSAHCLDVQFGLMVMVLMSAVVSSRIILLNPWCRR